MKRAWHRGRSTNRTDRALASDAPEPPAIPLPTLTSTSRAMTVMDSRARAHSLVETRHTACRSACFSPGHAFSQVNSLRVAGEDLEIDRYPFDLDLVPSTQVFRAPLPTLTSTSRAMTILGSCARAHSKDQPSVCSFSRLAAHFRRRYYKDLATSERRNTESAWRKKMRRVALHRDLFKFGRLALLRELYKCAFELSSQLLRPGRILASMSPNDFVNAALKPLWVLQ